MSSVLKIERCPETGICSIVRSDATKVDLMPDEAAALREAAGDPDRIKAIIAEADAGFAADLSAADLAYIGQRTS